MDLSLLLPEAVARHYAGKRTAPEVLLAAWSWYERGVAAGLEQGRADLEAERARLEALLRQQLEGVRDLVAAAPAASGGGGPRPAAALHTRQTEPWTPKEQKFPPGHGEPYKPPEPQGDGLEDFVSPDVAPAAGPQYGAIGHFTADQVEPVVRHAEAIAKNPALGAKVARDLLAKSEPTIREIPSGIVGQIETALRNMNELRGENWKNESPM